MADLVARWVDVVAGTADALARTADVPVRMVDVEDVLAAEITGETNLTDSRTNDSNSMPLYCGARVK